KLGLEKCKQIVDGVPEHSPIYDLELKKYVNREDVSIAMVFFPERFLWVSKLKDGVDHHYYSQSEEKELEQYELLSQEKIEGGAMLVGDFSKARERIQSVFDDGADYVTDIRNHISPNTKVVEHE